MKNKDALSLKTWKNLGSLKCLKFDDYGFILLLGLEYNLFQIQAPTCS